jgi:hypothetical protein
MKRYRSALSEFVKADFGDTASYVEARDEALREDLHQIIKSNTRYFNLCVLMVLLLFVGSVVLVLVNLNSPARVTAIFGVTGLSFAALIKQMVSLWREKAHSEAAYALAARLPAEDLKGVITILLQAK